MSFSSNKELINSRDAGQKLWCSFSKIIGAAAHTIGQWNDLSMTAGTPRMNVYPGSLLTSTRLGWTNTGNMYHGAAISPQTLHLSSLAIAGANSATWGPSTFILCDYLMFYPLIDMDDDNLQPLINSTSLLRYTNGEGVRAMLVATADTAATPHAINISYTNSNGVSGRTLPTNVSCTTNSIIGSIVNSGVIANSYGPFLPLAADDIGVRSVESIQLDVGSGGGYAALVLVKPLATFVYNINTAPTERCYLRDSPSLPKIEDGAFLNLIKMSGAATAAASIARGYVEFVWN